MHMLDLDGVAYPDASLAQIFRRLFARDLSATFFCKESQTVQYLFTHENHLNDDSPTKFVRKFPFGAEQEDFRLSPTDAKSRFAGSTHAIKMPHV